MICPKCSAGNVDTAKFCNECATPLTSQGNQSQDQSAILRNYIPKELAERMISSGKALESERRVVTVLFADVTGFTAISEKLDPEQVTTILNECFRGLIDIVYRYEGFIDKFIGDEIMAIFGAPIAHENDPERAIRCSQEMLSYISRFNALSPVTLPQPLGIHIGINTGTVVAGNVGSDLRMNYSVIGDTVNLAARLVGYAKAGQIITSETTYNAVHNIIKAGEPEIVSLKGKSEPVKVYSIIGIDQTSLPGERQMHHSEFVGRGKELEIFTTAITALAQHKEFRLLVRGEAGVGKSRLKLEFKNIAAQNNIIMHEGKCSSFEINTPYYLWNTLFKSVLGIDREASESETRNRLHDFLQIIGLSQYEPYLATLLSLRYEKILLEEDDARKAKIFESVVEVLKMLSTRKKIMIVFEDLHWVDKFSDKLLHYVFQQTQIAPSIFVFLFRGEYTQSNTLLQYGGTLLDLNRLSLEEATKLISSRLNVKEIPTQLLELIYKRSEGNPFFVEEIIRTMLERKSIVVENGSLKVIEKNISDVIPDTVQGIIMSRIDRLEERIKDVLYPASVIGREFSRPVLEKVINKSKELSASLNTLNSLELILPKEEAKELEYLFKHYLIQEVAYNTLLIKKRKELHGKIALAIETLYPDQLRDYYELLSFHYEKAENWEKAASFLSMSGRKAEEIFSKEESKGFTERKDAALEKLFESEAEKSTWFTKFLMVVTVSLAMVISIILISMGAHFVLHHFGIDAEMLDVLHHRSNRQKPLIVDVFLLIFGIVFAYVPLKLLRINSGINKLRIYEVLDTGISLLYRGGERFVINFSDIHSIAYIAPIFSLKQKFQREFSIIGINHQPVIGEFQLNSKVLPLFVGSGNKEFIYIRRTKGKSGFFAQLRFKTNPIKTIEIAQNLALTPANTVEFFEQLSIAFKKWQAKNCLHCRIEHKKSDVCPQCGYSRESEIQPELSSKNEKTVLRPVQKAIIDIFEFLINYYVIFVSLFMYEMYNHTKNNALAWIPFVLVMIPLVNLLLRLYFKRLMEKNMEIEISETALTYTGEIPFMKGYTIPLQDIISTKMYSNLFQKMFGLANIEIESRIGMPFTNDGPLFYFVIPNIRDSVKIMKLLKERCKFLKQ